MRGANFSRLRGVSGEGPKSAPRSPPVNDELVEVEVVDSDSEGAIGAARSEEPAELDRPTTVGDVVDGAKDVAQSLGTGARRLIDRGRFRKARITR